MTRLGSGQIQESTNQADSETYAMAREAVIKVVATNDVGRLPLSADRTPARRNIGPAAEV